MKNKFKAFLFLQFGALGLWGPYLPLALFNKHYSGIQIGLLLGTMPIVVMILQPVWSYLSDRLNTRKNLLMASCLGMGITMIGIGLADSFVTTMVWTVLFSVLWAPLNPIGTAMMLEALEETGELGKFSLIRLWGSIGFGVTSLLGGILLIDRFIDHMIWMAGGMYILLGLTSFFLPEKRAAIHFAQEKPSQILAGNPRLLFYLLGSVFVGATLGINNNHITLFLESLHAQDWLVGLTVSLQAFVEVPLMLITPWTLRHRSQRWVILTGALLLPLRWLLYLLIKSPVWLAPIQIFHGVVVVSFYVVGISFVDQLVDLRWRATGQGLYFMAVNGIGVAFGSYLAGVAFEWFGIRSVWYLNTLLNLIGVVFLLITFYRYHDQHAGKM